MTDTNPDTKTRHRCIGLIAFAIALTLVTGLVHGRLSQRWGPAPDLLAAAKRLESFPQQFGDWQLLKQEPIDESTIEMLSCVGYVNREYVNRKTGETVWIAIMLGPAGPIAVHTPEVCYSSRAYTIHEPRKRISLSDPAGHAHSFWSLAFRTNTPTTDQLRVCYAWYGKEGWEASKSPRFEFGGLPLLYKVQVASLVPPTTGSPNGESPDPCERFLGDVVRSGWSLGG